MKNLGFKLLLLCVMSIFTLGASATPDKDYLCFTANEDGSTVVLVKDDNPYGVDLQYSTDDGENWENVYFYSDGYMNTITLEKAGDKVFFRNAKSADEVEGFSSEHGYYYFEMSGSIAASGNVMSLIDCNVETKEIPCEYCFAYLFYECHALTSAPELPATELAKRCYYCMFEECKNLTSAPELLATELAEYCYGYMFFECTNLTSAPELRATTLKEGCYYGMFDECTNLTSAPELFATELAEYCYEYMFEDCTNLTSAPELPATTLKEECYFGMFEGCTNLTSAPELPATTLANSCYKYMFYGCSSLKYVKVGFTEWDEDETDTNYWLSGVPISGIFVCSNELDAEYGKSYIPEGWAKVSCEALCFTANENESKVKLVKNGNPTEITFEYSSDGTTWKGYELGNDITLEEGNMVFFRNSSSSTTGFSTDSENYYQFVMEGSVSSSGVLDALLCKTLMSPYQLGEYCFYNLFKGCEALTTAPFILTTELAAHCYQGMFQGCTSLVSAPKLKATTLAANCYQSMFQGCTSLATAPALPSTTLAANCYQSMFQGCTSLVSAPVIPASKLTDGCCNEMFKDCSNLNQIAVFFDDWTSTISATDNWVEGVSPKGKFFCLGNLTKIYGNSNIPNGWESIRPDYLCFTANEDNSTLKLDNYSSNMVSLRYKVNNGSWSNYEFDTKITLTKQNDKVYFSNASNEVSSGFSTGKNTGYIFRMTGSIAASGNIMSLVDASCQTTEIPNKNCFAGLFKECTSLTSAPDLPAITLKESCYDCMFYGCTNLTTVPKLPATELQIHCYQSMFQGCSSLVDAPELPATTLAEGCYKCMFEGCTNLKSIKVGFKEWYKGSGDNATGFWVKDIKTEGVFYCPAELKFETGDDYIPSLWKTLKAFDITANQDPKAKTNYYATFYSSTTACQVPDGMTAYTGAVDGSVLKLTAIEDNIIPASQGVILKLATNNNTDAQKQFIISETTETATWSGSNALTGTDVATTLGASDYALSLGQNGVGFYLWEGKSIDAHKAYLTLPSSAGAKAFTFEFDDGPTGIESLTPALSEGEGFIYNLNGVRVNDNYKGIVIKNGKKIYNK